jgi:hypothetical protein
MLKKTPALEVVVAKLRQVSPRNRRGDLVFLHDAIPNTSRGEKMTLNRQSNVVDLSGALFVQGYLPEGSSDAAVCNHKVVIFRALPIVVRKRVHQPAQTF